MSSLESVKFSRKKRSVQKAAVPKKTELTSDFGTDMVNVFVGAKRKKWTIHKNLICNKAPYFQSALESGFRESEEQEVHLKDDDPEGFDLFVYWLYRDRLPSAETDLFGSADLASSRTNALCMFYIQADKFLLPSDTKTTVLSELLNIRRHSDSEKRFPISLELITYTLQNTAEDDPLRTIVLDFASADYVSNDRFINQIDEAAEAEHSTFDAIGFLRAFKERFEFNASNNNKGKGAKTFFDPGVFYKHYWVESIDRYQTGYLACKKAAIIVTVPKISP